MLGLATIAVSALLLAILCRGDPKRRRSARLVDQNTSRTARWTLGLTACLPGVACLLLHETAAFLIWMGGTGIAGWLIVMASHGLDRHANARRLRKQ
jgi:hypothetical protein